MRVVSIIGELDIRKIGDDKWKLLSPIEYQFENYSVVVEKDFIFDGGSIPRPFWSIVPPMGTAADWGWVLHDWLYHLHRDCGDITFTREEADNMMLEVHEYRDVNEFVTHGSWTAVRGGAEDSWLTPEELLKKKILAAEDEDFLDQ